MMCCFPFAPTSRICHAARTAESVVQEHLLLEQTAGVQQERGTGLSAFRVQAETITEAMLLRTQVLFPDVVSVAFFDRRSERQSGAGWLWLLNFGTRQIPMLIQAKKVNGSRIGNPAWRIGVNARQKARPEQTANRWGIAAQCALNAPSAEYHWRCFPHPAIAFFHLIVSVQVPSPTIRSTGWHTVRNITPFTCLCCCSRGAGDAADQLGIARGKVHEIRAGGAPLTASDLIAQAREDKYIRGVAEFWLGGEG